MRHLSPVKYRVRVAIYRKKNDIHKVLKHVHGSRIFHKSILIFIRPVRKKCDAPGSSPYTYSNVPMNTFMRGEAPDPLMKKLTSRKEVDNHD